MGYFSISLYHTSALVEIMACCQNNLFYISAIILTNADPFHISYDNDKCQIKIRKWTLKGHSITHPHRWAMRCLLCAFWRCNYSLWLEMKAKGHPVGTWPDHSAYNPGFYSPVIWVGRLVRELLSSHISRLSQLMSLHIPQTGRCPILSETRNGNNAFDWFPQKWAQNFSEDL